MNNISKILFSAIAGLSAVSCIEEVSPSAYVSQGRLTEIAAENPNFTAADFEKLKQLSDQLYHEEEKSDNLQAHYVKASLDEFNSNICASTLSTEDELILKESENLFVEKFQKAIDTLLTPIQKKRLYLNCFRKMSIREIAKIEGTHYTVVAESIRRAKKKLKNYLINF